MGRMSDLNTVIAAIGRFSRIKEWFNPHQKAVSGLGSSDRSRVSRLVITLGWC